LSGYAVLWAWLCVVRGEWRAAFVTQQLLFIQPRRRNHVPIREKTPFGGRKSTPTLHL
jgi:hypothetical protein